MNTNNKLLLGYAVYEDKKTVIKTKHQSVKFGVISDTHLGSHYQQLTYLKKTYKFFKDSGAEFVLHAGDVSDGEKVYRGQDYETFLIGADQTIDYVVREYPGDLPTYMISGNHDLSFFIRSGIDIIQAVSIRRPDIYYLGQMGAYVYINNIKVYLTHGMGSPSYAISYKSQKLIEGFSSENKPNVLLVGHYHSNFVSFIRNVFVCHPGSFQGQTPMLRRLAIFPVIGGYLVEITIDKKGLAKFKFEFLPHYSPKFKDY